MQMHTHMQQIHVPVHSVWLDAELRIQRADCEVIGGLSTTQGGEGWGIVSRIPLLFKDLLYFQIRS